MKDVYGKDELDAVPVENTKWRVNSPEESKALQEWLFSRGMVWISGRKEVLHTEHPFLYIREYDSITFDCVTEEADYNSNPHKEMVPFFSSYTGETQLVAVAPASAGWKMNGGECPYIERTRVDVIYNDGIVNEGVEALTAYPETGSHCCRTAVNWRKRSTPACILAHKPHTPKQEETIEKTKDDVEVGDILRGSENSDFGFTPETRLKVIDTKGSIHIGVEWLSGPSRVAVRDDPDAGGEGWILTEDKWEYFDEEDSEASFPVPGSFIEAFYPETYSKWMEVFYIGKDILGNHVIQTPAGELKSVELSQIRPITSSKEKEQEALVEAIREKYNLLQGFSMDVLVSELAKDGWLKYPE